MRKVLVSKLLSLSLAPAALAQMDHSHMDQSPTQATEQMVHAEATLDAIGGGSINVSYGPIAEIGWSTVTMDVPLMESVSLPDGIEPGDGIIMMPGRDSDGMSAISGVTASG
ncbi:copper-binding protein [Rhodovulum kholense]|uniref:Cu/Ag efflux protein CusF n=1 Tax=Rhodovulum kholense TaxID=453584 RepID=A0A8E3ARC9_9RHOB|nr:copper-binding protein [Rhodovulum kholense]PTW48440.1 hypothetical protein C8N38_108193 [Rhodovulum kholense]